MYNSNRNSAVTIAIIQLFLSLMSPCLLFNMGKRSISLETYRQVPHKAACLQIITINKHTLCTRRLTSCSAATPSRHQGQQPPHQGIKVSSLNTQLNCLRYSRRSGAVLRRPRPINSRITILHP